MQDYTKSFTFLSTSTLFARIIYGQPSVGLRKNQLDKQPTSYLHKSQLFQYLLAKTCY